MSKLVSQEITKIWSSCTLSKERVRRTSYSTVLATEQLNAQILVLSGHLQNVTIPDAV